VPLLSSMPRAGVPGHSVKPRHPIWITCRNSTVSFEKKPAARGLFFVVNICCDMALAWLMLLTPGSNSQTDLL
jgi:hypothetical protein